MITPTPSISVACWFTEHHICMGRGCVCACHKRPRPTMSPLGKFLVSAGGIISSLGCWVNDFHLQLGDDSFCMLCRRRVSKQKDRRPKL